MKHKAPRTLHPEARALANLSIDLQGHLELEPSSEVVEFVGDMAGEIMILSKENAYLKKQNDSLWRVIFVLCCVVGWCLGWMAFG